MPQIFHISPDNQNQAIIDSTEKGSTTDITNLEDTIYFDFIASNKLRIVIEQNTSNGDMPHNQAFIELNGENSKKLYEWINQTKNTVLRIDQTHDNIQCSMDSVNNLLIIVEMLDIFSHSVDERASFTINNHNISLLSEWIKSKFQFS